MQNPGTSETTTITVLVKGTGNSSLIYCKKFLTSLLSTVLVFLSANNYF